jgi:hypothetical protein
MASPGADFFDGAQRLHQQDAVMGDNGPPAFADDLRMRHLLLVANLADVKNDVVGVFLQRVIGRTVKGRPAAVVIHAQTAADIQRLDGETHFVKLGVKAGRLLHGLFDGENVRHLRADVEMQQFEAMLHFFRAQNFVAATNSAVFSPNLAFSPPLSAHLPEPLLISRTRMPMQRLHAHLARDRDDVPQLLQLLDHHDDFLAQLDAHQRHADEEASL